MHKNIIFIFKNNFTNKNREDRPCKQLKKNFFLIKLHKDLKQQIHFSKLKKQLIRKYKKSLLIIKSKVLIYYMKGIKRQIVKLNEFSLAAQQFQKSIKLDKKQIKVLKKYNEIVQDHFDKFKINQDRTRKQIKDHQKIIELLLNDKTDQNIAYFNVIQDKKSKTNINSSNKEQPIVKYNSFCQLTNQKVHQYSNSKDCEQKISKAIESYKKMNLLTRSIKRPQTCKTNSLSIYYSQPKYKQQKNNNSFNNLSKSILRNSFSQFNKKHVSNHHNYSKFFKQNKIQINKQSIKINQNKENIKNKLNIKQNKNNRSKIWCSFNKQNKIKKANISKMKNNFFQQNKQQKQTDKQDQLGNQYRNQINQIKQNDNKQKNRSQSIQKQKHNSNNNKNRLKTVGSPVDRRSYYGIQKSTLSILS